MSNTARSRFSATATLWMGLSCAGAVAAAGCGPAPGPRNATTAEPRSGLRSATPPPDPVPPRARRSPFEEKLLSAEQKADREGRAVLAAARKMIEDEVVVTGSCWGYVNEVFNRAGFKHWRTRKRVFRGKRKGPYANPDLVKAGDWLYIIRYPAVLATHSVIFVFWVDKKRGEAAVITYVGDRRDEPGMYRVYDVSRIYEIRRAKFLKPSVKAPR